MTIIITKTKLAIAIVAMALIGATTAMAVDDNPFTDVPDSGDADAPFYSEPVEWLWDNGLTTGTSATTFSPNDPITRGQYAAFNFRYDKEIVQPALTAQQAEIDALEAGALTRHWAWVNGSNGEIIDGSDGVTSSKGGGSGFYTVDFNDVDVRECSWSVNTRYNGGLLIFVGTSDSMYTLTQAASGFFPNATIIPDQINVSAYDDTGALANQTFQIQVICG